MPEYVITVMVATVVSGGMLAAFLYGGRMHYITSAKLQTSDQTRVLGNTFARDVRAAANFRVGEGNESAFVPTAEGKPRIGGALQIFQSADTNEWVIYYRDASDQDLKRVTHDNRVPRVFATFVTNSLVFSVEDFRGNVITSERAAETAGMTLQFSNPVLGKNTALGNRESSQFQLRVYKRTSMGYQN